MTLDEIVAEYITTRRPVAQAEREKFGRLLSLEQVVHHAARCHRAPDDTKQHPHQRVPIPTKPPG